MKLTPRAVVNMPSPVPDSKWAAIHKANHIRATMYLGELRTMLDLCEAAYADTNAPNREVIRGLYEKTNELHTKIVEQVNAIFQE